jgi:hypothetical protein
MSVLDKDKARERLEEALRENSRLRIRVYAENSGHVRGKLQKLIAEKRLEANERVIPSFLLTEHHHLDVKLADEGSIEEVLALLGPLGIWNLHAL